MALALANHLRCFARERPVLRRSASSARNALTASLQLRSFVRREPELAARTDRCRADHRSAFSADRRHERSVSDAPVGFASEKGRTLPFPRTPRPLIPTSRQTRPNVTARSVFHRRMSCAPVARDARPATLLRTWPLVSGLRTLFRFAPFSRCITRLRLTSPALRRRSPRPSAPRRLLQSKRPASTTAWPPNLVPPRDRSPSREALDERVVEFSSERRTT